MGGIRDSQPSADQTGGDALPHYFLKQPPEYLPKAGFPPPQLTDRAVVRYPVKQIQGPRYQRSAHPSDALLDLPLRGNAIQEPTSRYFTSTTGSMGGRPYFRLYKGDVSSYTKDRSSAASSFRRKCSCGIRSSIVTMCSFSCIQPTACFFFYSTTADDIFPLCQQPQHGPNLAPGAVPRRPVQIFPQKI